MEGGCEEARAAASRASTPSPRLVAAQQTVLQRQQEVRALKQAANENSVMIARSRGSEYNEAAFKRNAVRQGEASARERKRREKELMARPIEWEPASATEASPGVAARPAR